ncbi:MAG: DUF58 domain-containing protein [Zetaproteobacteria bacterium]|nr:MAG: DUF58 domain-containing protein [Zetaproteobacteria bacterium]
MFAHPTAISLQHLVALSRKAEGLHLLSGAVRGPLAGGHLSRLRGRGMEFDEVRRYQTGDDARAIDWKVTARKGAPYIKLFREERERPIMLCIDYRPEMFFATRGAFKSVLATSIAALYGWAGVAHGDRVGGLLFDGRTIQQQRPRRGRHGLLRLLGCCCRHRGWQPAADRGMAATTPTTHSLAPLFSRLRRITPTGSLVVLISDGRGFDEEPSGQLAALARHSALLMIRVTDPLEHALPAGGPFPVQSGGATVMLDGRDRQWRARYAAQAEQRDRALRDRCRALGIHLRELSTGDDPLRVLAQPA